MKKLISRPLMYRKEYAFFARMMSEYKSGKTGIYVHPDFVMIDTKTYKKLNPPKNEIKYIVLDELK